MRLLLTSSGIANRSIAKALQELTGKLPQDCKVGFVPIAANVEDGNKDWVINQFLNLWRYGYNWVDIVDPTAADVDWQKRLADVDVLFLSGGNTFHLLNQVCKTGFDKWLVENLREKVYVGGSASTILITPTIELASMPPGDPNLPGLKDLTGLNLVDFEVEPHCDAARFDEVKKYATNKSRAVYAIDEETAIKVADGLVAVVSEGTWHKYDP